MKQEDLSKLEKTIEYYFKSKDYLKLTILKVILSKIEIQHNPIKLLYIIKVENIV